MNELRIGDKVIINKFQITAIIIDKTKRGDCRVKTDIDSIHVFKVDELTLVNNN